jgi:3',5'-cyclic AMP phosphodiesterase CpdA
MRALSDAFNKMNTLGLDGVFISGDLTCSALREEFQTFRHLTFTLIKILV